jgi:Domain of unknown function (DUF4189)
MHICNIAVLLKDRRIAVLLGAAAFASVGSGSAAAQMTNADVYEHVVKPQEEQRAAEVADILARPSNWGPGEIRSNGNYGGIAWYAKPNGDYGYIVARGYISPTSAKVQMDIECDGRKVACEEIRMLTNQWLVIAKRTDKVRYITASGQSRKDAEAMALEQCKNEGGTCIIQDAFDVMPNKRGVSHLRPKVKQR